MIAAVLLDRDGTIVRDEPYNGDPALVEPLPGAKAALDELRGLGLGVALVSNQSGIARGRITRAQVEAVNARIIELLGPFDAVLYCAHGPEDGCSCRKPQPGMLLEAMRTMGVDPHECVMIGDKNDDIEAAHAAGVRGLKVDASVGLAYAMPALRCLYGDSGNGDDAA